MTTSVSAAVERLNGQLPLAARQRSLPPELAALHRAILRSLFEIGRPLTRDEASHRLTGTTVDQAVTALGASDLVVLAKDGLTVVGAYPMTTEPTPHTLILDGRRVNAMCALDALSVTPMFGGEAEIRSSCRVTGDAVRIRQRDQTILDAAPSTVLVGVRWQAPCSSHAAHSMCMEMVFLRDEAAAALWHQGDLTHHSVFNLAEAVEFGASFFRPLVVVE